jgi:hypothetical protein
MSAPQLVVGGAVAKAQREIALRPTGPRWAVAHDDSGMATLVARLQAVPPPLPGLDATGGYRRAVVAALAATGIPVVGGNPRQARDVANAPGPLAQPEALEARAWAPVAEAGHWQGGEGGPHGVYAQAGDDPERHGDTPHPLAIEGDAECIAYEVPLTHKTVAPLLRRSGFRRRLTASVAMTSELKSGQPIVWSSGCVFPGVPQESRRPAETTGDPAALRGSHPT